MRKVYAAIVGIALVFLLLGCSGGITTGTATPDLSANDMAREQTIKMVIDMRATRDARP